MRLTLTAKVKSMTPIGSATNAVKAGGTREMKRRSPIARKTRIRRRGKKPRPGTNLALRERYKRQHVTCELSALFPEDLLPTERGFQAIVGHGDPIDAHHIFNHPRLDAWSNLICVRGQIHAWGHDHYPNDFRIICLAVKARKGELDQCELQSCLKAGAVFSEWVEAQYEKLRLPIGRRFHKELMKHLKRKAA